MRAFVITVGADWVRMSVDGGGCYLHSWLWFGGQAWDTALMVLGVLLEDYETLGHVSVVRVRWTNRSILETETATGVKVAG